MSNFGKSYSTKGNQVSRRSLIYVKLFGNYQAQKLSSFFYKYRQIPICSLLLERTLYTIHPNIWYSRDKCCQVCSNVPHFVFLSSKRVSHGSKPIDYSPLFCWVTFHCYEIVKMGYVLFISHAFIRINVFGVR